MKLRYLTENAYEQLYKGVNKNLDLYISKDSILIEVFPNGNYAKESNIIIDNFSLYEDTFDIQDDLINVKNLYTAMKKLTPEQASNVYLWTCLSHDVYYDYIKRRWGPTTDGAIKDRYFCDSFKGSRIGLFRNGISRLWWYGYLTYQEGRSNPFVLTELLLSNSDLCLSLVERKFSMNKNVIIGILSAIQEINDSSELNNVVDEEWRGLAKYINRYGAVSMLDFLSIEEIHNISKDFILNMRKK